MLYLYPSNKLEHLSALLHSVMKLNAHHPLQKRVLLVQHTGMQHWLSMALARAGGVSMQLDFPLPTRFIWETCRAILGDELVPQQSPYKREVMVWRILEIITSAQFHQSPYADQLRQFWLNQESNLEYLQQFRFAQQLADLFEQYLVFRPDWLIAWDEDADIRIVAEDEFSQISCQWQKWFWRRLVEQSPMHPVVLQQRAMQRLSAMQSVLPEHIYLFAINTMPPGYMAFFNALAEHTNIHWFHLNPSVDYWADAKSDRTIARQMRTNTLQGWVSDDNIHPLLRNLGKQGKDLLAQLLNSQYMEISAFDPPHVQQKTGRNVLQQLQADILKGADASSPAQSIYDSPSNIHVHACYHEVRELQVLKDFLLYQLEQDHELDLDDILVMCPAIEDYSPFIRGIFESSDNKHLSLSISDRKPIESQPIIAAFMQLLYLTEARFSVEQVLSLLETPALMKKFSLTTTDMKYCRAWVENVRISFALDSEHKANLVSADRVSTKYTWEWGIERMLVATFISEEMQMANGVAIAHAIDGQTIATLGKLMAFLSALKHLVHQSSQQRDIQQWRKHFESVLQQFFDILPEDEFAYLLIEQALGALSENANLANFDSSVSLDIVRQALKQGLALPETKSRFMCGKITFCSMMPMRSIPFKIVAILGLNQKSFPRQSYPNELDLIAKSTSRVGDRSRRDDDRYLFLEALVSARRHLYLSYQYRNIQSNAEREPSLVLNELIQYCHAQYSPNSVQVVEHPLHPFSQQNFRSVAGWSGSYDQAWAHHANSLQAPFKTAESVAEQYRVRADLHELAVNDLVMFFEQPLDYFAKECLQLRFDEVHVSEYSQPFDIEPLQKYALRQALFKRFMQRGNKDDDEVLSEQRELRFEQAMRMSGALPELPDIDSYIQIQRTDIDCLVVFLQQKCDIQSLSARISAELLENDAADASKQTVSIDFHGQIDPQHGLVFPVFKESPKLKDRLQAWISYVLVLNHVANTGQGAMLSHFSETHPFCVTILSVKHERDKPKLHLEKLPVLSAQQAKTVLADMLRWFIKGNQRPLFVNPQLIDDLLKFASITEAINDTAFARKWETQAKQTSQHLPYDALAANSYFHYFFARVPPLSEALLNIYFDVYIPMLRASVEPMEANV